MARCYDHESARTTENGAIIKEDMTIETCIIKREKTTECIYYILIKQGGGHFKETSWSSIKWYYSLTRKDRIKP